MRKKILRLLRRNYPDLWALMLKWDADSPVSFKADGRTVHDYEQRFRLEDEGLIPKNKPFRWSVLDETQLTADWYITHAPAGYVMPGLADAPDGLFRDTVKEGRK